VTDPLLDVDGLTIEFGPRDNPLRVVDDVSFSVKRGEAIGIVGESGSGKSMTSLSILRLVSEPPARVSGRIVFEGTDLMKLPKSKMPEIRGKDIAMIFQEPMSSLNPVMTIGDQIGEALMLHGESDRQKRRARVIDLLRLVGMPDPESRLHAYPGQFSGGMRQRVMVAMAVACNPKLLIADEPTTALDVTIQAQVLELMLDIRRKFNAAILLISHDLGIIAEICERVVVMYAGRIVEDADIHSIFASPKHPYTQGLLKSVPTLSNEHKRLYQIPGSVPPPGAIRRGCPFRPRCSLRMDRCAVEMPPLVSHGPDHIAACWATAGESVAWAS
jgi:peptide/nickel transport system ATP-binding protein